MILIHRHWKEQVIIIYILGISIVDHLEKFQSHFLNVIMDIITAKLHPVTNKPC